MNNRDIWWDFLAPIIISLTAAIIAPLFMRWLDGRRERNTQDRTAVLQIISNLRRCVSLREQFDRNVANLPKSTFAGAKRLEFDEPYATEYRELERSLKSESSHLLHSCQDSVHMINDSELAPLVGNILTEIQGEQWGRDAVEEAIKSLREGANTHLNRCF